MSEKTTRKATRPSNAPVPALAGPSEERVEETPFEALASICAVVAVLLFIQTFIGQNFVIPSGSMEPTLLIGDHLVVDRTSMAAPAQWMPLVYHRAPHRGDVVVFFKPVFQSGIDPTDSYMFLVKRLIGIPGDHIHLQDGTVYINGVAQHYANAHPTFADDYPFLDNFPSIPAATQPDAAEQWALAEPGYIRDGDLVVPPGMYFMMGDNRHNSLDSRYWGFVSKANIMGRPMFNYWSFKTSEEESNHTGIGPRIAWMGHIALHFFTDTRWKRTFHVIH